MSFLGLNGSTKKEKNFWNYSNKEKSNYTTEIVGNIIEMQFVCKTVFGTNMIDRYKDGNPKRNVRLFVLQDNGEEIIWEFGPGGKDNRPSGGEDKRSEALKSFVDALVKVNPKANDVDNALGMRIKVSTKEPPEGFSYGQKTQRPWTIQLSTSKVIEHRGSSIGPDWEREGSEPDGRPVEAPQVGDDPNNQPSAEFLAAQKRAADAVAKMNAGAVVPEQPATINAQAEIPPASVYDDDIPF